MSTQPRKLLRSDPIARGLIVQSKDRRPLELTDMELVRMKACRVVMLFSTPVCAR